LWALAGAKALKMTAVEREAAVSEIMREAEGKRNYES
jgi:hypothetical protein